MRKLLSLAFVFFYSQVSSAQGVSLIAQIAPSYSKWTSETMRTEGILNGGSWSVYDYGGKISLFNAQVGLELAGRNFFGDISIGIQTFSTFAFSDEYHGVNEKLYLDSIRNVSRQFSSISAKEQSYYGIRTRYFVGSDVFPKLTLGVGYRFNGKNNLLMQLSPWDCSLNYRRDSKALYLGLSLGRFFTPLFNLDYDSAPANPRQTFYDVRELQYVNFSMGLTIGYRIPIKGGAKRQKTGESQEF